MNSHNSHASRGIVCAVFALPLLAIGAAWALGGFAPVVVENITAYPVFRAWAAALLLSTVLALGAAWWIEDGEALPRGFISAFLVVLVAAIAMERLYTLEEAFERDLMAYMMVADGILDGRPLYSEMWDIKPPGIHWTYALFAAVFGVTPLAIWAMGLVAASLTLWGCYCAGKQLVDEKAGLIAAALWAVMSGDIMLQANQPNVEVFMNAGLVWAFVWMLRAQGGQTGARVYALIGALLFAATLYKHYVAVAAVLMVGRAFVGHGSAGHLRVA